MAYAMPAPHVPMVHPGTQPDRTARRRRVARHGKTSTSEPMNGPNMTRNWISHLGSIVISSTILFYTSEVESFDSHEGSASGERSSADARGWQRGSFTRSSWQCAAPGCFHRRWTLLSTSMCLTISNMYTDTGCDQRVCSRETHERELEVTDPSRRERSVTRRRLPSNSAKPLTKTLNPPLHAAQPHWKPGESAVPCGSETE